MHCANHAISINPSHASHVLHIVYALNFMISDVNFKNAENAYQLL